MHLIKDLKAIEILDSRGNWTIETTLELTEGFRSKAQVPAGASVGEYEKKLIPAETAVATVNEILAPRIKKTEFENLAAFDKFLIDFDSTSDRSNLGSNTILSLSIAFCKALALKESLPLYRFIHSIFGGSSDKFFIPQPLFNLVNGGAHAKNDLDFQEFIFIPHPKGNFRTQLETAVNVFHTLGSFLEAKGFSTELGDEGGYAPHHISHKGVLNLIMEASKANLLKPVQEYSLGLDVAASTLVLGDLYNFRREGIKLSLSDLTNLYSEIVSNYPIIYLEDPFAQDDFKSFRALKDILKNKVEVVGDDLTTTNQDRVKQAIKESSISSVIIKPNQIGSVSETLETAGLALKNNISLIASHRSGETEDTFIADLAVGIGAKYIKAGAPARGERVAKYNRILEIEQELSESVHEIA